MIRRLLAITVFLATVAVVAADIAFAQKLDPSAQWGQWRGPLASGVAPAATPPTTWASDKNIRWKADIPGYGHATPIIWGDVVLIQTAILPDGAAATEGRGRGAQPISPHRFVLIAFDRATGRTMWQRTLREEVPHEGTHADASQASGSPLTDGTMIIANFGSHGLYGLDMNGKTLWDQDLGDMRTRRGFGEGGSPALSGNTLIMPWDHEGPSFIVALNKTTGKELWRASRDEVTTWATPLIIGQGQEAQAVMPGANRVRSYAVSSGKVLWECSGLGVNCVPSPVQLDDTVVVMSGYRDPALLAIRYPGASGDITGSKNIRWQLAGDTSYVPSPLLYGDTLYLIKKNSGMLSCFNARSGEELYRNQRLETISGVYSSIVGAAGRVYVVGRGGTTQVIKHGPRYEVLANNTLDDEFAASPAVVGDALFLRGRSTLYCIAEN